MRIRRRDAGEIAVLEASGRLAGGDDQRQFHDAIRGLVAEGRVDVLIDLSRLIWLDSTGLGALVAGYHTVARAGGRLKLCAVNDRIDGILGGCGLYSVFETYRTEAEALAAFARPPA